MTAELDASAGRVGAGPEGPLARADGMWASTITGWHYAMWGITALGILTALTLDEVSRGERLTAGVTFLVLLALYVIEIQRVPWSEREAAWAYLTAAVIGLGVACAIHPTFTLLLFIVYPQAWLFTRTLRQGAVVTALLTGSALFGMLEGYGFTWANARALAPQMLVSMGFSLLLGWWISRIIEQSHDRAALIAELDRTRVALAEANHQEGIAQERARMAGEIHDTLAQGFTSVVMLAQAAAARPQIPDAVRERLTAIEDVARANLAEARALVAAFSPADLDGAGLADAVQRLARRFERETATPVTVEVTDAVDGLMPSTQVVLLRAVQEGLANVRRHAAAHQVSVRLTRSESEPGTRGGRVGIEVRDDGAGFDPTCAAGGFGLAMMRRRVHEAGGEVELTSALGRGTVLRAWVPFGEQEES
ncbi:MAG: sensor histidine kinase [Kineosporiaceae bacterium]|nr:sensor histidine kinase [Kineosporiaceae bacterium]